MRSLTARLVITFLGLSVAMVLAMAIIAYNQAHGALKEQVLDRLRSVAESREKLVNKWVEGQRIEVEHLSGLTSLRQELPGLIAARGRPDERGRRKSLTDFILATQGEPPQFRELLLLSVPDARVLLSTDSTSVGTSRVNQTYFIKGQDGTFIQNVHSSATPEGRPMLTISTPVRDEHGRVIALLVGHVDLQEVYRIFGDRSGLGQSGEAYLVDSDHAVLSAARFGRPEFARGATTVAVTRAVDAREDGDAVYLDYRGTRVIGVYRWMDSRDLALIVEMDTTEAFAPAQHLLRLLVTTGVFSALVLAVLMYLASLRIARPVVEIARTAERVAGGDFSAVAQVRTRDEVGQLAGSFNEMTARLRVMYEGQQQQVRELSLAASAIETSKRLLQSIIDNTTELIVVTGLDDAERILMANLAFTRLLHVEPADVIGRPSGELFAGLHPMHPDRRRQAMEETLVSGKPVVAQETFDIGGEKRTGLLARFLLREADGSPYALCTVATDITDLKKAEDARQQFSEQLQHTQKLESLGVMAGGIAHDFNNLLTVILGHADILMADLPGDSPSRSDVERIVEGAQRAAGMTNQMLAYSGRGKFVVGPVSLSALATEMSQLLQVSISKKVDFLLTHAPDLPPVQGDPAQLQQIIMNLITNAAEAIGDRKGTITLQTDLVPGRADAGPAGTVDRVRLVVTDSGSGMTEATLARIFEPFYTTKFTGRGLGLAAVQGIVHGHGGTMEVESTLGTGTKFTIHFPAAAPLEVIAPPREAKPAEARGSGTVLVVDDEQSVRSIAQRGLERAGYRVLVAEDGAKAMAIYHGHWQEIDAVLLDLTMPVMDGRQVLTALRVLNPSVRVILTSGFSAHDIDVRGDGGYEFFLQKPYVYAELVEVMEAALR